MDTHVSNPFLPLLKPIMKLVGPTVAEQLGACVENELTELVPFLKHLKLFQIRQLRRSVELLSERLRRVEIALDREHVDGFANMCFRYFEAGAKEHRDIKLRLLAAACAHCADGNNTDSFDIQLEVFEAIERLQPFHMHVLVYLAENSSVVNPSPRQRQRPEGGCSFRDLCEASLAVPDPRPLWLAKTLVVLNQMSAVVIQGGSRAMLTSSGLMAMNSDPISTAIHGSVGITEFGTRLVDYVKTPTASDTDG